MNIVQQHHLTHLFLPLCFALWLRVLLSCAPALEISFSSPGSKRSKCCICTAVVSTAPAGRITCMHGSVLSNVYSANNTRERTPKQEAFQVYNKTLSAEGEEVHTTHGALTCGLRITSIK